MALKDISGDDFTRTIKEIIEQNLDNEHFSIEQLCKEASVSRTHLHRKIKASTNFSTSIFIRKVRLQKAKELLESTDHNISEVAYLTGNKSPQNFSKYFIEEFGVSPSQYRKQQKGIESIAEGSLESAPVLGEQKGFRWGRILIGFFLLLLVGFALKGVFFKPDSQLDSTASLFPSIAVIPFQAYGPETADFFSEGVVEDILTYLAQFEGLRVISRTSTNQFKDTDKSIQQIGQELNVNYILEGSVRQDSQNVFITAQLIRVSDDQHIWAERYDRSKESVIDIQTEVAKSIARALNQSISSRVEQKLGRPPTDNIEAYTAFLRGRHLLRSRTKEDLLKSLDQFEATLAMDSTYSEAYVGMAEAYHLLSSLRYVSEREQQYDQLAEKNALLAIRYDQNNGSAYSILANLYVSQYRWEEAKAAFEIALELNPNDALANYWYSLMLRTIGDLEQSLKFHEMASTLDPLHPVIQAGYIYTCVLAGEFDKAEQIMKQVEPIMGKSFLYYYVKGNFQLQKGDYQAAILNCRKALELNPTFKQSESDLYYCMGKLGEVDSVRQYISSLDTTQAVNCLRAAKAFISLGATELCLQYLEKAASLGLVADDMLVNPIFSDIQTHPTYMDILEQFNLHSFLKE